MGLKDIWRNWSSQRDRAAINRVAAEAQMTGHERTLETEGIDGLKANVVSTADLAGAEAATSADDELV